jgi:hypothetical protein
MPSVNPKDMLTEVEQLRIMACEDVVDFKLQEEKSRTSHMQSDDENEVEVKCSCVPYVLISGLSALCGFKIRSKKLVTKTLSHQVEAILSGIDTVEQINGVHSEMTSLSGEVGGISEVLKQMGSSLFSFISPSLKNEHIFLAKRIISHVSDMSRGTGVSANDLLAVGYILALSTAKDAKLKGVVHDVQAEAINFIRYIRERRLFVNVFQEIAKDRAYNHDPIVMMSDLWVKKYD